MIAIIVTAFVGVCIGVIITSCIFKWYYPLKNAKTYMPPPKFPVPTITIKEIRESDRIEEEYKKQQYVVAHALTEWHIVYQKTKTSWKGSLRESIEAAALEDKLDKIHDREKKKLEALKKEFEQAIAKEAQPSRPPKGISLEQILAIPRCDGYSDDRIRKLFGTRHYVIPQTIIEADIPAEDKLWALFHLMGDNKRHRLALEASARANAPWVGHSDSIGTLWDVMRSSRQNISSLYGGSIPSAYWNEVQWQLKRAIELMEEPL